MQKDIGREVFSPAQINTISEKTSASSNKRGEGFYFAGFKSPNFTPIPDEFFDLLAPNLSEAELRVLLYIMRRTFGFKKQADAISLSQLTGGIRKRNGEIQDAGTGLSKPAALKGVAGLQEKGIIAVEKRLGEDGRNEINVYRLRYAEESYNKVENTKVSTPIPYSTVEYLSPEKQLFPSPDLRPVPNNPPLPQMVATTDRHQPAATGQRWEQVGAIETDAGVKESNQAVNSGVKQIYPMSKANLPTKIIDRDDSNFDLPMNETVNSRGKGNLPERVQTVNRVGKIENLKGVKQITPQHGSLQKNSKQETTNNSLLRSQQRGNLAIKTQEAVVDITENNLLEQEKFELEQKLVECGFSRKAAEELTVNWSFDYIWQKIRLTENLCRRSPGAVKNLPGFLRQAILEDYRPAPSVGNKYAQGVKTTLHSNSRYRRVSGPGTAVSRKPVHSTPNNPVYSSLATSSHLLTSSLTETNPVKPDAAKCALLWDRVCAALSERFRRPDLVRNLSRARLEIEPVTHTAKICLERPWLQGSILSAERALLQLAFSQEVGAGYTLEIYGG
jgi:hypothetical protein